MRENPTIEVDLETFAEERAERKYLLRMVEDLKLQFGQMTETLSAFRGKIEERTERDKAKAEKDLRVAHDRIRALETDGVGMRLRNWILTVIVGAGGAVILELFRWWLGK